MELKNKIYIKLSNKYNVSPISQTKWIRKCNQCGENYEVKFADLKRWWWLCCSKSCSASRQWGYSKPWYDIRNKSLNQYGYDYDDDSYELWQGEIDQW